MMKKRVTSQLYDCGLDQKRNGGIGKREILVRNVTERNAVRIFQYVAEVPHNSQTQILPNHHQRRDRKKQNCSQRVDAPPRIGCDNRLGIVARFHLRGDLRDDRARNPMASLAAHNRLPQMISDGIDLPVRNHREEVHPHYEGITQRSDQSPDEVCYAAINPVNERIGVGPAPNFFSLFSLRRNACGSNPAERQTAGKSVSSLKRYDSASRCERSGPETHSSTVRAITAVQTRCSAMTSMFESEIANTAHLGTCTCYSTHLHYSTIMAKGSSK